MSPILWHSTHGCYEPLWLLQRIHLSVSYLTMDERALFLSTKCCVMSKWEALYCILWARRRRGFYINYVAFTLTTLLIHSSWQLVLSAIVQVSMMTGKIGLLPLQAGVYVFLFTTPVFFPSNPKNNIWHGELAKFSFSTCLLFKVEHFIIFLWYF